MEHKILLTLLCTGTILLLGSSINMNNANASQARQRNYNLVLKNQGNHFAKQRKSDYYPSITYNTRDLGGYWNSNHTAQIRNGMLYRSASLHKLNRKGANDLKKLHIHTDIDLRNISGPNGSVNRNPSPGEVKGAKNPYKIRMRYRINQVENNREETESLPYRKKYGEIYRFGYWYTLSPDARRAYHNSLYDMVHYSNNNNAVMYNCNSGRDRTGVLSAITLSILGIPRSTIYNDFMLTNHYHQQTPYPNQHARLTRFYITLQKKYKNMNNYLHKGLGLTNRFMNNFRNHFLVIRAKPKQEVVIHKAYRPRNRNNRKIVTPKNFNPTRITYKLIY